MNTRHLFVWAAAMMALAACNAEKAPDNPTYNPDTNTVNAQFVLNVSTETGKDTKTTADYAQMGGKFLGMSEVHLLAYQLDDSNLGKGGASSQGHFFYNPWVGGKAVAAARDFDLGSLFAKDAVTSDKASRVVELALPLGINSVSLYGKATKTADSDYQGSVFAEGDPADLTTLKFTLESRLNSQDAYDVGAFFFSSMLTYFLVSGLVDENSFWSYPSGTTDRSYGFWYPIPASLEGFPANPEDQDTWVADNVTYTYYTGQLSWKQLGTMHLYTVDGNSSTDPSTLVKTAGKGGKGLGSVYYTFNPLGEALGEAYYVLSTVEQKGTYKELRAGSASAVLRVCEDLYSIVDRVSSAAPTGWEEHCAKLLGQLIKERMDLYFKLNTDGYDFIKTSSGTVDVSKLKSVMEGACSQKQWKDIEDRVTTYFDETYFYDIDAGNYGFPINVGLPYGAAILNCEPDWSDQKKMDPFVYVTDIPAYGMGGATFPIANYRYPPELMYYGNSSIRVTDSEKKPSDFPTSVAKWSDEDRWSGWTKNGAVKSSTRSVAMKNTLNYGTALLRSTVKFKDGVTKLKDNNAALHPGEEDNEIRIDGSSGGFLVTGIVVGGQADVMGWDFTRYPDAGSQYADMGWDDKDKKYTGLSFAKNGFDKMVYDRVVGGYQVGMTTTPIYTMLWDNYDATKPADAQNDVYIGVELLNQTGQDFWGELNLVRKNGIFYLLGKLTLSKAVEDARKSNPEAFKNLSRLDYCYPPYNPLTGETVNAPRVFMQDYVTEAVLNLGEDALKHAYATVPDLRASQVSMGLSIDMAWKPGLAFNIDMGVIE